MNVPERIVIHANDIMLISGISERASRRMLSNIRKYFRKRKDQFVRVEEFCEYTGLTKEEVLPFIR